jgi:serine/threonine protein kinase
MAANGMGGNAGGAGGEGDNAGGPAVAAVADIPRAAKETMRNLLRVSKSGIDAVLARLASTHPITTEYLTRFVIGLPHAEIIELTTPAHPAPIVRTMFRSEDLMVAEEPLRRITAGSYGVIYKGRLSGSIYKEIKASDADIGTPMKIEQFIKEILCEVFIQVLLSTDVDYGRYVPAVTGLFVSNTLVRQSLRQKSKSGRRNTPQVIKDKFKFFIKMEACQKVLSEYLLPAGVAQITMDRMAPVCRDLGDVLAYFKTTYGFLHRDLHYGNIMVNELGGAAAGGAGISLKLIDFGHSCVTIRGVTYSRDPTPCESYDLLILMASFREPTTWPSIAPDVQEVIRWFFKNKDGHDCRAYVKAWFDREVAEGRVPALREIFHYFYHRFSLGADARGWPNHPWLVPLAAYPGPPPLTMYEVFFESGAIPSRVDYEMFIWKWTNPTAPDPAELAGGGKRSRGKRRQRIDAKTRKSNPYARRRRTRSRHRSHHS